MIQTHEQFHDLIVERLALATLPASERAAIVTRVVDILSQRIFVDLLPLLSEEDRFVLRDMLSDGDLSDEEIDQFLRNVMVQYEDSVRKSVEAFFEEMRTTLAQYDTDKEDSDAVVKS